MMKSERRHELATNELADWIANFPQWFNENLTTIIIGAVVVAGLVVYTIFYYHRESRIWSQKDAQIAAKLDQLQWQKQLVMEGKQQGLGISDTFLSMASSFQADADETENPILSALAIMKRAEALRAELHYRSKIAEPDVRKFQLQQAQKFYEQALEKAKGDAEVSAMAEYGSALCLEDMGDFAGAKQLYDKIAQADEYKGTMYQARAQIRSVTLSDNEKKAVLVKAPQLLLTPSETVTKPLGPLKLEEPMVNIDTAVPGRESDSNLAQ